MNTHDGTFVPVSRPQLPSADSLMPYLRLIDERRTYSNHGPLVSEFERRIATEFGGTSMAFCSASSGTAAISGAILGLSGRAGTERPLAFLPSFTYVGTVVAVEQCGFTPFLFDCDAETWTLRTEDVAASPQLAKCGMVVVVAPFGRPVPQAPWIEFSRRYGVPVVIDGAASFDLIRRAPDEFIGALPVALSFHATKAFGVGEGGGVITSDRDLSITITQCLNFGFFGNRNSATPSMNGKLSEYHAAVGLAELDEWKNKELRYAAVAQTYRTIAAEKSDDLRLYAAPDISCSYVLYEARSLDDAEETILRLNSSNVSWRYWYGSGIAGHSFYADARRSPLPVTETLAARLIGLPTAPDLPQATIRRVVDCLVAPSRSPDDIDG